MFVRPRFTTINRARVKSTEREHNTRVRVYQGVNWGIIQGSDRRRRGDGHPHGYQPPVPSLVGRDGQVDHRFVRSDRHVEMRHQSSMSPK
jgi:hypothetical protein